MKLNGKKIEGVHVQTIVIPRGDEDLVFKARAVLDYEPFLKLCPPPIPPKIQKAGETEWRENVEDPKFKQSMIEHSRLETEWMFLESFKETPNLEWETVVAGDPSTWRNWRKELEQVLVPAEISRLMRAAWRANALDDSFIEERRKSFASRPGDGRAS